MSVPLNAKRTTPLEGGASFSLGNRLSRAAWWLAWLCFARWTPAPLHRWRNLLLRIFGASMHQTSRIYGSARVWYPANLVMRANAVVGPGANCYCMDKITIGEKAVVSQGAQLCAGTHDISDPNFQLVTRPIVIGPRAWVAADAFVGPGVTVNEGAVIGARAVLFKDAEAWGVYAGNPASRIKTRVLREE